MIWRLAIAVFFVVSSIPAVATDLAIGFGRGGEIATADQVSDAVGNVNYAANCAPSGANYKQRTVIVTLEKAGTGWRASPILRAILNGAIDAALVQCPMFVDRSGIDRMRVDDVGEAQIYASSTTGKPPVLVARAVDFVQLYRYWSRIVDVEADRIKADAAAAALAQAERERQAAATRQAQWEQQQAQAAAVQAQRNAEARARSTAEWNRFWSNVWFTIKLVFWGAIAAWLFSMRETFARWYYSLTPHPAQSMVEASMHRGVEIDGQAFAEIMRPMPGGRIEKEVRAQQARNLAEKAHRYATEMRAEADRIKAEAERDIEFIKAQDELTKAATVHEKAKARLDALRKRTG